jgi:hypothetical protein
VSDLQCPATFWLVSGPDGLDRVRSVLGAARVAGIYADPAAEALASTAAEELGAPVHTTDELAPLRPTEDADAARARWRGAVEDVADLYRGETVLLVGDAESIGRVVSGTPADVLRVEVDADGWRVSEPG